MNPRHNVVPRTITPAQEKALFLYALGLNVFPQPYGQKGGSPHRRLQNTRLFYDPSDPRSGDLLDVTAGKVNLAIMTGRTSRNLFIFDAETAWALVHLIEQLKAREILLWVVKSPSKRGGGHVYFLCADGEVANIPTGKLRDMEVRGNRNYVLTVGSKHPDPADPRQPLYDWFAREGDEVPTVTLEHLDGLTDLDGSPIRLTLTKRRAAGARKLFLPHNRQTANYLRNGQALPEGQRRMALFYAACDFKRCHVARYWGYEIEDAFNLLAPIARASGLPEPEIDRAIREAYDFATLPTYKQAQRGQSPDWHYAAAFSDHHDWHGRTGATDHAVMLALVERARVGSSGNGSFRGSGRELAELAHCTVVTVRSALRRLQVAGLIAYVGQDGRKVRQAQERLASLWRFTETCIKEGRKSAETNTVRSTSKGLSSSVLISASSDILERGALGMVGLKVYHALLLFDAPATVPEIAARANVTAGQARYHLIGDGGNGGKLLQAGLIERHGKRKYSALPATDHDLERLIALPAGVAGKSAARRDRHARERALYAGRLIADYRAAHDYDNFFGRVERFPTREEVERIKDAIIDEKQRSAARRRRDPIRVFREQERAQ